MPMPVEIGDGHFKDFEKEGLTEEIRFILMVQDLRSFICLRYDHRFGIGDFKSS